MGRAACSANFAEEVPRTSTNKRARQSPNSEAAKGEGHAADPRPSRPKRRSSPVPPVCSSQEPLHHAMAGTGLGDRSRASSHPTCCVWAVGSSCRRARACLAVLIFKDDEPLVATGASGSGWIPSVVLQVVSYVIDQGMPIQQAVDAPRFWLNGPAAGYRRERRLPRHQPRLPTRLGTQGRRTRRSNLRRRAIAPRRPHDVQALRSVRHAEPRRKRHRLALTVTRRADCSPTGIEGAPARGGSSMAFPR